METWRMVPVMIVVMGMLAAAPCGWSQEELPAADPQAPDPSVPCDPAVDVCDTPGEANPPSEPGAPSDPEPGADEVIGDASLTE